jgi:large subunit ribosomal protein L10
VERAAKKEAVEQLNAVFKTTSVAIVAHYSGLTVAQMQKLRMQMKQAGASVKVSKNRLTKIALEGTDVAAIGSLLKGPTVIATSKDPVAAPKVAIEFAKTNERFVILGGSPTRPLQNSRASFRLMPQRAKRPDALRKTQNLVRTNSLKETDQWLTYRKSSTTSRA